MITHQNPLQKIFVTGLVLICALSTYSQRVDLHGTVISGYGNPVPDMIVTLNNAGLRDTTDSEGKFHILGEATSVVSAQKTPLAARSGLSNFIYLDRNSPLPSFLTDNQYDASVTLYDLRGKAISFRGAEGRLPANMAPGIYFIREQNIAGQSFSRHSDANDITSVDRISITFNDSLRHTEDVESYTDSLLIQLRVKMFDRWPQVHAGDSMPPNPGLTVGPYVRDVTTEIHNNGYVVMLIGPDRPSCITDELARNRLDYLDERLREIIEIVGFPAFPEWKNGHFMNWVILNSGIPNASIPGDGGHQGHRWGHMTFESTSLCPCRWDDYQRGGAVHECIHALIAELWVYNNRATGWIHEAFNNYMMTVAEAEVRNRYTMGGTASLHLSMPQIPVESMGLATDGHVAGPADQGMQGRTYHSTQHRYGGEIFFLSLAQKMGRGFNVSLFTVPPYRNQKSILQVFIDIYGEEAYAAAIMSYAAKSAILDFEEWTGTMRRLMENRWNTRYWFYMFPDGDGTTTFRPPQTTTPHHQGRNVIPIRLASGANSVTVEFTPDERGSGGTRSRMRAQFVYRDRDDNPVYGPVFSGGRNSIDIPNGARNGIVNLVVAVVHPNAESGSDDDSNKGFDAQEKFSYQARIVSGGTIAPTSTRPW